MHVLIAGNRYDFDALNRVSLGDLIELKKQTGLSMGDIEKIYTRLQTEANNPDFDFLGDEGHLLLLATLVWLGRRKAGERLTFEESAATPLSDITFVPDADEGENVAVEETVDPR